MVRCVLVTRNLESCDYLSLVVVLVVVYLDVSENCDSITFFDYVSRQQFDETTRNGGKLAVLCSSLLLFFLVGSRCFHLLSVACFPLF